MSTNTSENWTDSDQKSRSELGKGHGKVLNPRAKDPNRINTKPKNSYTRNNRNNLEQDAQLNAASSSSVGWGNWKSAIASLDGPHHTPSASRQVNSPSKKPAKNESAGWGESTPKKDSGAWGESTPKKDSGGWGESTPKKDSGVWGESTPKKDSGAWGESTPKKDSGGWGASAPKKDSGAWGESTPKKDSGGWGASTPKKDSGGWGASTPKKDSGGWGASVPKKDSGGWGASVPKKDSGSWENVSKKTAPSSTPWGNSKVDQPLSPSNGWDHVEATAAVSKGWEEKPVEIPSWTDPKSFTKEETVAQVSGGGWDDKPVTKDVQWGELTLDKLGWDEKGKKESKEIAQGEWKNGVHVLGEDNEKVRLKVFGTAEDDENVHSGINFDKYDNIPVETKGKNVPECITQFSNSGLDNHLLTNIELAHFKVPTPVQKYSIPIVMKGHDLMACAQTGSGKTGGYLFPILSAMFTQGPLEDPKEPPVRKGYQFYRKSYPQALILAPTRELASQIYKEAKKYCYRSYVRPCVAYGGADIATQLRLIDRGCHVLIATPGRLVQFLEKGRISFKNIRYLVLDEADRMLDMGFEPQVRRIVDNEDMPSSSGRQTLMFSATFPKNIQLLARDFLSTYIFLSVGRVGAASDNIAQEIKYVTENEKKATLLETLQYQTKGLTLIFAQTKRMTDSVYHYLREANYSVTAIHGDRVQSEREEALESFKKGITPIMVATAVAARGLDIPNVTHVISYDLPNDIDDYVHRIGRTGRAGNTGLATAFFTQSDRPLAKDLVKLLKDAKQNVPNWLEELSQQSYQSS